MPAAHMQLWVHPGSAVWLPSPPLLHTCSPAAALLLPYLTMIHLLCFLPLIFRRASLLLPAMSSTLQAGRKVGTGQPSCWARGLQHSGGAVGTKMVVPAGITGRQLIPQAGCQLRASAGERVGDVNHAMGRCSAVSNSPTWLHRQALHLMQAQDSLSCIVPAGQLQLHNCRCVSLKACDAWQQQNHTMMMAAPTICTRSASVMACSLGAGCACGRACHLSVPAGLQHHDSTRC